ncbi:MAG: C69 family dipeptidase [Bacteroidales bacterium]|nr:C69 family dipeptidase [Lentimicrobiaceae bacterium]MDD5695212.1 C69 family dipeptidase [Bacteroidales bacterium]
MIITRLFSLIFLFLVASAIHFSSAQTDQPDWVAGYPDGCTSITVGKLASADGSVYTSHTDDSHRTRSEIWMTPAKDHPAGATTPMFKRIPCDTTAMPSYANLRIGEIPQVAHTFAFINSAYPCMNEHQLGIGESTFGGRPGLHSDIGLIDCQRLCQLMVERCTTARDAIRLAGELTAEYGWIDEGECLTIADKNEVWHLEIVGPGKGKKGSIWVAQRIPDDHVGINANASTIKEIDLKKPDYFMASENIFQVAIDSGWWNPASETFRFCYAYAPESRTSYGSRRREWRVFDLLAPSLKLDANAENYPFSVKPDHPVTTQDLVNIFKDYYEDTPYNFIKDITVTDENGKTVISPLANPFMPYDMNKVFKINGGWGWMGERTIARWYTMYATIIQCRSWLPDEIGGVAWLAMDNVATSIYIPVYCCVTDLPQPYKTPGRTRGFTRESAWWAFNYLGTLTAQRWGDMRHDVDAVWNPWQKELFAGQAGVEQKALELYNLRNPQATIEFLTGYTHEWGNRVVNKAWELGDYLWTKYDEKF